MSRSRTLGRRVFDYVSFLAFRGVSMAAGLYPRETMLRLGDALGLLWFALDAKHRRLALSNLRLALGAEKTEAELRSIRFKSFMHLGRIVMDLARAWDITAADIDRYFVFEGEENIREALAMGKGVVAISAHFGNWELMGGHALRHGRAHVMAKKIHNPHIDELIRKRRLEKGIVPIDVTETSLKIFKALRANEPVAFLMDQSAPSGQGIEVDFFGHPASTYTGPAAVAIMAGCPVFTFLSIVLPDGRTKISYGKIMKLVRTGDFQEDLAANTRMFTKAIEDFIRQAPEQWLWVHDRWKKRRDAGVSPR